MDKELTRIYNAAPEKQKAVLAEQQKRLPGRPGRSASREQVEQVLAKLKELVEEAPTSFKALMAQSDLSFTLSSSIAPKPIRVGVVDGKLLPFVGGHNVLSQSTALTLEKAAEKIAESGVDADRLERIWIHQAKELVSPTV